MNPTTSMVPIDDEPRTTLTSKPIQYQHDHHNNMMVAEGAGFGSTIYVGATLLPPEYTDKSLVRIPIKVSDFTDNPIKSSEIQPEKKGGLFKKMKSLSSDKSMEDLKVIAMGWGKDLGYWVKGEDGKFAPSVEEPPASRAEWIRVQLVLNEEWKGDGVWTGPRR